MILVTGANGFIGHALCARLLSEGFYVRGAVRRRSSAYAPQGIDISIINSIGRDTDLVSDGQDISTPDLIRMIAGAMDYIKFW